MAVGVPAERCPIRPGPFGEGLIPGQALEGRSVDFPDDAVANQFDDGRAAFGMVIDRRHLHVQVPGEVRHSEVAVTIDQFERRLRDAFAVQACDARSAHRCTHLSNRNSFDYACGAGHNTLV